MNRRKFFGTLIGGVAAGAAVRAWPFRVFSFPTDPRISTIIEVEAAIAKAMKEFSDELTRIMYTDGVGIIDSPYLAYWRDNPGLGRTVSNLRIPPQPDNLDRFDTDLMYVGSHRTYALKSA